MKYTVFDVETPNFKNDRISSIGICVIEDGEIKESFYSLVNPETHFDKFNVELTGISEQSVIDAPTFDKLWIKVKEYFDNAVLVAHNAPFDMSVLSKCLNAYGIIWKTKAPYACTCQMARRAFPSLPSKKLNSLCELFNIKLSHHNAESDAMACAELFLIYERGGIEPNEFIKEYSFIK